MEEVCPTPEPDSRGSLTSCLEKGAPRSNNSVAREDPRVRKTAENKALAVLYCRSIPTLGTFADEVQLLSYLTSALDNLSELSSPPESS